MSEKMWFEEYSKTHNKIRKEQRKEDACTRTNATYRFQCSMGTSSKKALQHLKGQRSCTAMTEVKRDNRTMATEEEEIRKEVELFYTSLDTPAQVDMAAAEELQAIASPLLSRCSTEEQADLIRTITLKEVRAILKEAPKGNAPGPDNLPVEVYRLLQAPLASEMM
ncbi:hypothetical protein DSO57_1035804 [Entomophthora muscae]|uniref:Uncharacterized protein n=1 Tax=Entomophthora muscae TaxID=34485 RepID=A0ACC2SZM5_9FUNG|nr:hypothetical protein DSO57_1035804 [Entomophthora muscae]